MALRYLPSPQGDDARVRARIREILQQHVQPNVRSDDETSTFRRRYFDILAAEGFASIVTPPQYGGLGLGHQAYYGSMEELARISLSLAITMSVTNLPQGALLAFGSPSQKDKYLKPLGQGKWLGAFSLSEPQSGSDAAALRLSAKKVDGGYLLNGTKCWCSTAGYADLYLVMARTGEHKTKGISAFLVPKESQGFRAGKQEKKMGWHASPLGELIFEDTFVSEEQRLGKEGDGFKIALSQLDSGRIVIGVVAAGIARAALDLAWEFYLKRKKAVLAGSAQFPSPGIEAQLTHHFSKIQALRCLIDEAARQKDAKNKVTSLASQIKLLGSDLAVQTTIDAVQTLGEYGSLRSYEVERLMRDAKALQIVEGTNQIQTLVLAREMEQMFHQ